jgi:hypothetical protein
MTRYLGRGASALLLIGLAGCGPGESANDSAAAPAAEVSNGTAAASAAPAPVVLEGGGLRIGANAPARTIAFDEPQAATIDALTAALGGPPTERGANSECGEGALDYAEWKDRITIWFQEGKFVGWDIAGGLETAGGIGIGSPRAHVAALPGYVVEESTLGVEFRSGQLSGLLASAAPDASVTDLWSGSTCVFR